MAVEVTKTYKITCDVCGRDVSSREDARHVTIHAEECPTGVGGDICLQCMDTPLAALIRKLTPAAARGDEDRIREAMIRAEANPGQVVRA